MSNPPTQIVPLNSNGQPQNVQYGNMGQPPFQGQPPYQQGRPQQGYGPQGQPQPGFTPQGQPFGQNQQSGRAIQNQGLQPKKVRDFNLPPPGYKDAKFPRQILKEADLNNQDLGGCYQEYLFCCGNCLSTCYASTCGLASICCVPNSIAQIESGTVGLYERFGVYAKTVNPGLNQFNVCTDKIVIVDLRQQLIDCPRQWVMTKDNILVSIDATVYYRVRVPQKSIYYVTNMQQAVTQLTLATIKSITGSHTLQELLGNRQQIADIIEQFVDAHTWEWGIDVENMLIKDIIFNEDLQNSLSMAAKEKRAAQAKIIQAEGFVQSAKLMKEQAQLLDSKAAMQIRYLETITTLGNQGSTKVIFMPEDQN